MEGWFHSGRRVYFVKSIVLGAAIPSALIFFLFLETLRLKRVYVNASQSVLSPQ